MSFASLPFVGLVAAGVILYYLVPKQAQWVVLLLASMVFYLSGGVLRAFNGVNNTLCSSQCHPQTTAAINFRLTK